MIWRGPPVLHLLEAQDRGVVVDGQVEDRVALLPVDALDHGRRRRVRVGLQLWPRMVMALHSYGPI